MKQGLYRTTHPEMGDVARVHWRAGDGAPWLTRAIYEATHFAPAYDDLPLREEYLRRHPWVPDPPV